VTSDPGSEVDEAQRSVPIVDAPSAVTTIEVKYAERILPFMYGPLLPETSAEVYHRFMRKPLLSQVMSLDAATIDELYGLEPVFEPGNHEAATAELGVFVELQCPWCGEPYGSMLDLTDASRSYIEDCQICCRPIEVRLDVSERGELEQVSTSRVD
jgi:hypothetical protein